MSITNDASHKKAKIEDVLKFPLTRIMRYGGGITRWLLVHDGKYTVYEDTRPGDFGEIVYMSDDLEEALYRLVEYAG